MKIVSLELEGYKRFALKGIESLVYRPKEQIQVILGSNGSGKSSLIQELSPLPGNYKDFYEEGLKRVVVELHGTIYKLTSSFNEGSRQYSFKRGDEELNVSLNLSNYLNLCKLHFNYTKELHAVLTGEVSFCKMSIQDRRSWMTRIADIDYSDAIAYHKKIKETIRDLQGSLKQDQYRLIREKEKIVDDVEISKLKQEVDEIESVIKTLISSRHPQHPDDIVSSTIEEEDRVVALLELLTAYQTSPKLSASVNQLKYKLSLLIEESSVSQAALSHTLTAHTELSRSLEGILEVASIESVRASIDEIKRSLSTLPEVDAAIRDLPDPVSRRAELMSVVDVLTQSAQVISSLQHYPHTQDDRRSLLETVGLYQTSLKEISHRLTTLQSELKHYDNLPLTSQANCPKCNHKWYIGYDDKRVKELNFLIPSAVKEQEVCTERLKHFQEDLDEVNLYLSSVKLMADAASRYPEWSTTIAALITQAIDNGTMHSVHSTLNRWIADFDILIKSDTLKAKLAKEELVKKALDGISEDVRKQKVEELSRLGETILTLQQRLKTCKDEIESIKAQLSNYRQLTTLITNAITYYKRYRELSIEALQEVRRKLIDEIVYTLQAQTIIMSVRIKTSDAIKKNTVRLEDQIKDSERHIKLLSQAESVLSPVSGLIAKGLTMAIDRALEYMNSSIAMIWNYPLRLKISDIESDSDLNLTYNFQVEINDNHVVPDVSKTSAGMQEIINLGFVLVVMKQLNLQSYPIYLDEFAVKMDECHRRKAYDVIDQLTRDMDTSQLFIVSHYQEGYSHLKHSEINVLCSNNISIPSHLKPNTSLQLT